MGLIEQLSSLGDQLLVLGGDVVFLGRILGEVVEFHRGIGSLLAEVELDGLPSMFFSEPDGAFAALLVEFPVEVVVGFLLLVGEDREEGNAV